MVLVGPAVACAKVAKEILRKEWKNDPAEKDLGFGDAEDDIGADCVGSGKEDILISTLSGRY